MNGGKLKKGVKFFEYQKVSDGAAGYVPSDTKLIRLKTFAEITQIKATRTAENLQETINSVFTLSLRQRANFYPKSDYIVEWDGRICNITGVDQDVKREKYWVITVVTNPLLKNAPASVEIDDPEPYTVGEEIVDEEPYTLAEYQSL